uniref:GLI2 n=1 Tax=Panthera tigris altaica TaxID=74533 RepID=A0A8C9JA34_PANTA
METSASVTATEKKDAKSGSLEGVAFPDPGRKASALAVATAAAAAVAAQGGNMCSSHSAGPHPLIP